MPDKPVLRVSKILFFASVGRTANWLQDILVMFAVIVME